MPDPAIGGTFIGELKNVTVRQALGADPAAARSRLPLDGTFDPRVQARAGDAALRSQLPRDRRARDSARWVATTPVAAPASRRSTKADVFEDLANGVRTLLTERATFNVDRKAGLLQVTDFPERLDRVADLSRCRAGPRAPAGADRRACDRGRAERRERSGHRLAERVVEDERVGTGGRAACHAPDDERPARERRRQAAGACSASRAP